jgi:hypothetical protein
VLYLLMRHGQDPEAEGHGLSDLSLLARSRLIPKNARPKRLHQLQWGWGMTWGSIFVRTLSITVLLVVLSACGDSKSALDPKFQPQVGNQPDSFQFQTTGITNVTQTLHYVWQNNGIAATINQACSVTGGMATITLKDASGWAVYSADLRANGTFPSTTGTSGAWTIDVVLTNVSGTLNFRVQKM